eukprot:TRINITY_DN8153_c0_g1::TRINITY_DN8153_c0_g1_i1::g.7116::m.7116 TRINITY_DN8153_c0_g1::TRINITY_DN8153_c0_g1_i1::g.7116  ORF type:complete len:644 (+),score=141.02,sp/Q8BZ64/TECT1_MOUSE/24.50/3e-23,DUF1619/PF07773.6/1.9e-28,DUF1619/PF07773.6/1e+03 TRINITY_DN8153_c0_g1_i1:110-2041(+)
MLMRKPWVYFLFFSPYLCQFARAATDDNLYVTCTRTFDSYSIDWSAASSSTPDLDIPEDEELGDCVCDLTSVTCDIGCCCDSDCIEADKATWTCCCSDDDHSEGASSPDCENPYISSICKDDGPQPDVLVECSDDLTNTNMHDDNFAEAVQDHMLCVVRTNKCNPPDCGDFYNNPGNEVTRKEFDSRMSQGYHYTEATSDQYSYVSVEDYDVGTPLQVAYDTGALPYVAARGASLVIPAPNHIKFCDDNNWSGFLVDSAVQTCVRRVENMLTSCADPYSDISLQLYTYRVRVAKEPSNPPAYTSAASWVSVDISSYTSPSGTLTNTTMTWDFFGDTLTCTNYVTEVHYTVVQDGTTITSISAEVVLATVTMTEVSTSSWLDVEQKFSVRYIGSDDSADARPRSGNPGYLHATPVLAGYVDSLDDKYAVSQFTEGLQLLGAGGEAGACSATSFANVMFNTDMVSDCSIALSRTTLQTYCTQLSLISNLVSECESQCDSTSQTPMIRAMACHLYNTYLGVWGNASPEDLEEWVQLAFLSDSQIAVTWDSTTNTCYNVPTALNVQILTVDLGSWGNPQRRILSARFFVTTQDWRVSTLSATATRNFSLRQTVSFVNTPDQGLDYYIPPPPKTLPTVPDDFFYPFTH